MRVVGFDPYLTPENAKRSGIEKVELDELLAQADFITLHTAHRCDAQHHLSGCAEQDQGRCGSSTARAVG